MSEVKCSDTTGLFQTSNDVYRVLDHVQAVMPGLTGGVAEMVLWDVIEDFYIKSCYRREHVYWELNPGIIEINFDPYDNDWRVCRFLGFTGLDKVKFVPPGRVIDVTNPIPQAEREGQAYLALKPDNIRTELPYDVWTTYWETLFHGCMHRLSLQPAKPYSDLNAAQIHGRLYRSGIASARADAQQWHLRDGVAWNYPYFAEGGHPSGRRGGTFLGR